MKRINIFYWVFTGLFGAFMLLSAIPDVLSTSEAMKFMTGLGYPPYIIPFIGVAKVLGVIAIVIPGFARIKEWAYAGLFIDLAGAIYSVFMAGDDAYGWMFMFLPILLGVGSYYFYHRKLNAIV